MPTFIKAGFWEKTCATCKGYNGWLNLDQFAGSAGTSGTSGTSGAQGDQGIQGVQGTQGLQGVAGTSGTSGVAGDQYRTTSTSTFTLGTSTTLTIGTGLAYTPAQDVIITYDVDNHQVCNVVSYDSGTGALVIGPPVTVVGSGTYSSWTVNLNGAAGGDGSSGTSGSSGVTVGKQYLSAYSTQDFTGGSIQTLTFNNTAFANGVSIQNNSEITFTKLAKFNIQFSAQLYKTGGTGTNIYIWLRHNGIDEPDTGTVLEMGNNNQYLVASWNFFVDVNTNPQHFELMWYTPSSNVSIETLTDTQTPVGVPGVPSIILTVNEIS